MKKTSPKKPLKKGQIRYSLFTPEIKQKIEHIKVWKKTGKPGKN